MTNTLHRFGKPESLKDDFIVFIMASRGINHNGASDKVRAFLNAALKYNPVNIGNGLIGSMYRPEKDLSFTKVYFTGRKEQLSAEEAIVSLEEVMHAAVVFDNKEAMEDFTGRKEQLSAEEAIVSLEEVMHAAVVFDNKEAMEEFLKEVKDLDLGLSVNVSALADEVKAACRKNGITIHSVEYSLGFHGDLFRLPDRQVLSLTTMCGHGMISAGFARKLIEHVKEARITPEKAARYMAKFCVCGAFNTSRAVRILNEARTAN